VSITAAPAERSELPAPRRPPVIEFARQPALDGVRGLAVIAIILYHAEISWAKGGFIGVDVFFVLSGFLITTLLIAETGRTSRIDLRAFYRRRVARLLPMMLVVVAAGAAWAALAAEDTVLSRVRRDGLGALLYVNNWVQIHDGVGYFDRFSPPSPFTHLWSLSVEEQFYFVWPAVISAVIWCSTRRRATLTDETSDESSGATRHQQFRRHQDRFRRRIGVASAVGLAASATAAWWLEAHGSDPSVIYLRSDTRVQGIMAGCLVACLWWGRWRRRGDATADEGVLSTGRRTLGSMAIDVAGLVGLVSLMVVAHIGFDLRFGARGGYLLLAVVTCIVLVAATQRPGGLTFALLSVGWLRWLGTISYSLYLWHWLVNAAVDPRRTGWDPTVVLWVQLTVPILLAAGSYSFIERPGLRMTRRGFLAAPVAVAAVAVALVASTAGARASSAERFAEDSQRNAEPPPLAPPPPTSPPVPVAPPVTTILMIGDSFGSAIAAGWPGTDNVRVVDATTPVCGPFTFAGTRERRATPLSSCGDWATTLAQSLAANPTDVVVVGVRSWLSMTNNERLRTQKFAYDISTPQNLMTDELDALADVVQGGGATLVLTTAPSGVFPATERLPIDLYNQVAARVAAGRPDLVGTVDIMSGCATPCADPASGFIRTSQGSIPTPLRLDDIRSTVSGVSRARHLAAFDRLNSAPSAAGPARVLLVGDSVGWSIGSYWYGADPTPPPDAKVQLWPRGTYECELDAGPRLEQRGVVELSKRCADWRGDWSRYVERFDPDLVVVVIGTWEVFDRRIDGQRLVFGTPPWDRYFQSLLTDATNILGASGARVVFTLPPATRTPRSDKGAPTEWKIPSTDRFAHLAQVIGEFAQTRPDDVAVLDLASLVCPTSPCPAQVNGVTLRPDGVHYDETGGPVVGRWLADQLAAMTRVRPK